MSYTKLITELVDASFVCGKWTLRDKASVSYGNLEVVQQKAQRELTETMAALVEACKAIVHESGPNMPPSLGAIEQCRAALRKAGVE